MRYRQENKNINKVLNNKRVEPSALAEHVKQTGHNISWDDMRPLVKEKDDVNGNGAKLVLF